MREEKREASEPREDEREMDSCKRDSRSTGEREKSFGMRRRWMFVIMWQSPCVERSDHVNFFILS